MTKSTKRRTQITTANNLVAVNQAIDALSAWLEAYFEFEVTTRASSQKEQRRDLETFLSFMICEVGDDRLAGWTPRLTQAFKTALQKELKPDGNRRFNDRTINRMLAHLKTFARWIHKHRPFPLGDPVAKLKLIPAASLLDVERALTPTERRRLLDVADLWLETGGRSRDRKRYGQAGDRPRRKTYRPYRNRAIIYTLIETGMRRAAVTKINLSGVDFDKRTIRTEEKGGAEHTYHVSHEGLQAIGDYLEHERADDEKHFTTPALFLATSRQHSDGRLNPRFIAEIWKQACKDAGVEGKSPHSARHAMGRHLLEKTGSVVAIQRQLGHKNAAYSLQYARITSKELNEALDDRG